MVRAFLTRNEEESGKKPIGKEPKAPATDPKEKDQVNFTDDRVPDHAYLRGVKESGQKWGIWSVERRGLIIEWIYVYRLV